MYEQKTYITGIGTDPEFFVRNKETKEIVSFSGVFGFTKQNPMRLRLQGTCDGLPGHDYLFSEDNVAAEIAVPPASTAVYLHENIKNGIEKLSEILDTFGLEIAEGNHHFFSDEELAKGNAWQFGCEPDFCIYKLKMLKPPPLQKLKEMKTQNLRTTGGHMHIGISDQSMDKVQFARIIDYIIGKWTLQHEPPLPRRILYGRAGAIRMKNYGIEYRTPGNFWVRNLDRIREVFNMVEESLSIMQNKNGSKYKEIMDSIQETKDMVNGKPQEKVMAA